MIGVLVFAFAALGASPVLDGPPSPVWKTRLPGPHSSSANHAERSSAVATLDGLLLGIDSGPNLYLLSKTDGRVLKSFKSAASVQGSAALLQDRLIFGDGSGQTYCYSHEGELLWSHAGTAPILSTPQTANGLVFVTNVDDVTVALNVESGQLEWQYRRPKDATRTTELALFSAPRPIIAGDTVITGYSDGAVVGLALETGDVLWDAQIGEGRYPDIVGTPAVGETDVFASGYFGPLVAIDMKSQNIRWKVEAGAASESVVAKVNDAERLFHPGSDGTLRCIDTLTGGEVWTWSSGDNGALTKPTMTPAGVLIGATDGGVYLVDAESGVELWRDKYRYKLEGVTAAPLVDGRDVYFSSNAGFFYRMRYFHDDLVDHSTTRTGWSRIRR